jgi:hypothetical protein
MNNELGLLHVTSEVEPQLSPRALKLLWRLRFAHAMGNYSKAYRFYREWPWFVGALLLMVYAVFLSALAYEPPEPDPEPDLYYLFHSYEA